MDATETDRAAGGAMSPIRARFGTALNALLYTTDSDWARDVYAAYRTNPDIKFRTNVANDADLAEAIPGMGAKIVVVDHGLAGNETGLAVAARAAKRWPKVHFYLASSDPGPALVALHNAAVVEGIKSVIARPFTPEALVQVVGSVLAREAEVEAQLSGQAGVAGPGGVARRAALAPRLLAVLGGKGGTGKSQVATNLAMLLQTNPASEIPTAYVDFERGLESAELLFGPGIQASPTVVDWIPHVPPEGGTLDPRRVAEHLVAELPSGLHAVFGASSVDDHDLLDTAHTECILNTLRLMHAVTVADLPAGYTGPMLDAVRAATEVLVVTNLDIPTLKVTRTYLREMCARGLEPGKVWIVYNRVREHGPTPVEEANEILGEWRPSPITLPEDESVPRTRGQGPVTILADPTCPWSVALRRMAASILPEYGLNLAAVGRGRKGSGKPLGGTGGPRRRRLFGLF